MEGYSNTYHEIYLRVAKTSPPVSRTESKKLVLRSEKESFLDQALYPTTLRELAQVLVEAFGYYAISCYDY